MLRSELRVRPLWVRCVGHGVRGRWRFDGYYEAHINAWDVAAGIVLVTEAGGWCNDFFGGPDAMAKGNFIMAATPALVPALRALLSR